MKLLLLLVVAPGVANRNIIIIGLWRIGIEASEGITTSGLLHSRLPVKLISRAVGSLIVGSAVGGCSIRPVESIVVVGRSVAASWVELWRSVTCHFLPVGKLNILAIYEYFMFSKDDEGIN